MFESWLDLGVFLPVANYITRCYIYSLVWLYKLEYTHTHTPNNRCAIMRFIINLHNLVSSPMPQILLKYTMHIKTETMPAKANEMKYFLLVSFKSIVGLSQSC